MERDELFALAHRHSEEVWGEETGELGAGRYVLAGHGIDVNDAVEVATIVSANAVGLGSPAGRAALFLQGMIFGLWLSNHEIER